MAQANPEDAQRDGERVERLAFERLVADLSVRFANVSHDRIVAEIEAALARLVDSLGDDRCTYAEFAADGTLHVLCSAAAGGIEPLPRGPIGAGLPWLVGEIRAGRIVALADLPDGLPPEAVAEKDRVRQMGLRSHLSIPLRVGGRVVGALSFGGLRCARTWSEAVITRLTIVGEVFASAIARARSEDEAQRLRSQLWHADRVARTGALTATIAHELNQPLAAILSNAQAGLAYLDRGEAHPEQLRSILEAVVRDDKRAAETIRTMRALLRHDGTGRARIDLAAALREVLHILEGELRRQGVRVETEFEPGGWVVAEKAQIEQVALNLILNAATAMHVCPPDERRLRLAVSRTGEGGVVVTVCDSGTGIPREHLESVFEPFWTTRSDGLGLGLAVCRLIVQAHGGAISVAPNPGRGVTFRFELAGAPSAADAPAADAPADAPLAATASGEPTVCVVDDDASVRESLVRLLAGAGWKTASFASATEFLERAPHIDVACILLDNGMPGVSGLELQERLSTASRAPPVVFLSGSGDVATGVEAMKLGAVDYLLKPVDGDALVAAVGKALQRGAVERQGEFEREACRARVGLLTAREREVLEHVIKGRLNKQIAAELDIAEQTVKQHRGRVMEKMAVRSVADLVRLCSVAGVLGAPGELRVEDGSDPSTRPRSR